jgi:hypothetical protein
MLPSQLPHRREPRRRLGSSQELTGQNRDEIVDGSHTMSFANLKHNQMIPTGLPSVQRSRRALISAKQPCKGLTDHAKVFVFYVSKRKADHVSELRSSGWRQPSGIRKRAPGVGGGCQVEPTEQVRFDN